MDRKIEIPTPNEASRMDILKIHSAPITKKGEIGKSLANNWNVLELDDNFICFLDYESIVKLTDGFNGADLRNVCTEAGTQISGYFLYL